MANLHTSGAIALSHIKNLFGGPASPSLANYYRGGAYIPSSKAITAREPASGQRRDSNNRWHRVLGSMDENTGFRNYTYHGRWNGSYFYNSSSGYVSSYTVGNVTYWRGSGGINEYGIYRTYPSTGAINTSIPTSGAIALSQFYGAEKP